MSKFTGITFSGPDVQTDIKGLVALQKQYPYMEVGVLWSLDRQGEPRYVDRNWIEKASQEGLNFSIHLCGKVARWCLEGTGKPSFPGLPRRVQFNINGMRGQRGWYRVIESMVMPWTPQIIIQTCDHMGGYWVGLAQGEGLNVVPLFDKSGGKGQFPCEWALPLPGLHCGYAGGIGPANVEHVVHQLVKQPGETFWIDLETRVRVNDRFDLETIQKILTITAPLHNMA